jgi:hypothetical protein
MDDREDIYSGRRIAWQWVLVGVLITLGMQSLLGATMAAVGVDVTDWTVVFVVSTVGFALGGIVIGLMSPGYTAWEAGFASVAAAGGLVFLASRLLAFASGLVAILPLAVVWGLLCGLAGGWIGERIQSSLESSGSD